MTAECVLLAWQLSMLRRQTEDGIVHMLGLLQLKCLMTSRMRLLGCPQQKLTGKA
jgi:hypothetical protein